MGAETRADRTVKTASWGDEMEQTLRDGHWPWSFPQALRLQQGRTPDVQGLRVRLKVTQGAADLG